MSNFFNKTPYTDFHELNLDWLLERVNNIKDHVKGMQDDIIYLQEHTPDMDDYYDKTETDALLADKADVSDLPDMTDYYDKTETDALLATKADVSDLPDMTDYYDKTETDALLATKADVSDLPDMTDYYDKTETDALLSDKADVSDLPDMTDYYDKTETDALLADKADVSSLATVATTGAYADLTGKPTIPAAANNGQLTIQKNGSDIATFTANQSGNTTANITCENKISWTTSGNWRYWKDSAGYYHAYYNGTVSAAMTSSLGNLFYRSSTYTVNFPFTFGGIANIQVTCQDGSGLTGATIQNYSNIGVSLWLWAGNSGTRTVRLHIEVIGT